MIELPGIGRLTGMSTSLGSIERLFPFHFFDATAGAWPWQRGRIPEAERG